jgi:hypothetical protein
MMVAMSVVMCVALTCSEAANAWQQAPAASEVQHSSGAGQPDTRGAVADSSDGSELPSSPAPQPQAATAPQSASSQQPAQQNQNQQDNSRQPAGTAVAPYDTGVGVAASRPAGAAIAPAKQKRTRSILIKVGVLVGAAVAVGTVAGLSMASPSKPH